MKKKEKAFPTRVYMDKDGNFVLITPTLIDGKQYYTMEKKKNSKVLLSVAPSIVLELKYLGDL